MRSALLFAERVVYVFKLLHRFSRLVNEHVEVWHIFVSLLPIRGFFYFGHSS